MVRGRKSSWNSESKMMRLPAAYETQIFEFARELDQSSVIADSEIRLTESDLQSHIDAVLMSLRISDRRPAKRLLHKLRDRLRRCRQGRLVESRQSECETSIATNKKLAQKEHTTSAD